MVPRDGFGPPTRGFSVQCDEPGPFLPSGPTPQAADLGEDLAARERGVMQLAPLPREECASDYCLVPVFTAQEQLLVIDWP
jgi:hypothetical protein